MAVSKRNPFTRWSPCFYMTKIETVDLERRSLNDLTLLLEPLGHVFFSPVPCQTRKNYRECCFGLLQKRHSTVSTPWLLMTSCFQCFPKIILVNHVAGWVKVKKWWQKDKQTISPTQYYPVMLTKQLPVYLLLPVFATHSVRLLRRWPRQQDHSGKTRLDAT